MGIFTKTTELVEMSRYLMGILAVGYIAMAITQSLSGIMRGAGDTVSDFSLFQPVACSGASIPCSTKSSHTQTYPARLGELYPAMGPCKSGSPCSDQGAQPAALTQVCIHPEERGPLSASYAQSRFHFLSHSEVQECLTRGSEHLPLQPTQHEIDSLGQAFHPIQQMVINCLLV